MTYYRFPESRATKALLGLFLFAMLFLARDTLTTSCVLGFYPAQFLMLGIIALAAVVFLIVNRKNLKAIFTDGRILVVLIGLVISSVIGAVAGFFPAWIASRMEPVKAIFHS